MHSNRSPIYDERMYPSLKSAALETLFDLMDNAESDSDRRMAATAALRFLASVENARREPKSPPNPPPKSPPPAPPPPAPAGPRPPAATPPPHSPTLTLTPAPHGPIRATASTPASQLIAAASAAAPRPPSPDPGCFRPPIPPLPVFRSNSRSPMLRAGAAP